jgi:MFS family permease
MTKLNEEASPSPTIAMIVWGTAALFYLYESLLNTVPSIMIPELMQALSANREQIGYVSGFFGYAYASMQIPAGMLMDRFGPHRLLTLAAFLCAVGCIAFVYSDHWILASCSRFIMGLGAGFAVVGCMKVASLWFPEKRFALLAGLMVSLGMLGAAAGQKPLASLMEAGISWEQLLGIGALFGALLAVAVWLLMHHEPHPKEESESSSFSEGLGELLVGLKQVVVSTQTWISSLYASLMFVPTLAFGFMWGVSYCKLVMGVGTPEAAGYNSMIFIGWACGGPLFGWCSDHFGRRKPFLFIASVASLAMMGLILYGHDLGINVLIAAIFLLGFFSSGFVLAYSIVRESHQSQVTATAIGFVNTLNTLGGAIAIPIIGMLVDREALKFGGEITVAAYNNSLVILMGCLLGALFLLPFMKETYCRSR